MPRAPRIEFEDAVYHVMARGNRREAIVFNDSDRRLFTQKGVMRHFLTKLFPGETGSGNDFRP